MKKISIIIPVYNAEKFLEKLLNSILNQTYKNYEIILVNDGSTDKSSEIIEKYKNENQNIKSLTIENSGPGIARKIGYEQATGELLFFIDSDDFLPRIDILEDVNKIYIENNFDLLIFNFIRKYKEKEYIVNGFFKENLKVGLHDTKIFEKNELAGALWCKIFVKNKMKSEYFCDSNNYEDYYTTYKYLENCSNFYYTDKICYYANRDNQNSISKKQDYNKMFKTVELLEKLYACTKHKNALMIIALKYYIFARRMIEKSRLSKKEKQEKEEKVKELKKILKGKQILKLKLKFKDYLKYAYFVIKDFIGEKTHNGTKEYN